MIRDDEPKEHSPDFKRKVAREAIREEIAMAEVSKKYGVHPKQIGTGREPRLKIWPQGFPSEAAILHRSTMLL
ncbi:MAG: hypothetical protein P8Q92_02310 [Pseudoprimorskyibacter sp.]|nr:hypothetical protein [Pseudoprimorskyibacter sp.]